ncbi:MAG: YitT family protein [Oscillospiraceae bacterium]|nr:YitT family protein [Oscillospiraceae bacterium]
MKQKFSYTTKYSWLKDTVLLTFGSALYALGFSTFIEPNQITTGGVTGIAALISFGLKILPTGTLALIMNIPLLIAGLISFGKRFVIKTTIATVISSMLLDVFPSYISPYNGDKILAALAGGVLIGTGLALAMITGGTTGGIDIVAKFINRRMPHLSMGRIMLIIDVVIVSSAALIYRSLETSLYSILALFTSSKVIDSILYGADSGKLVYIITKKPEEMSSRIMELVGRGVTRMKVIGGYTQSERTMLMCATRRQEVTRLRAAVLQEDNEAFVIITDFGEILGEGFKGLDK